MNQSELLSGDGFEGAEDSQQRTSMPRPQQLRRHTSSRRLKVRTRQRPNNAAAKKGIHKRHNKHVTW
jgi:hypothetical protein